MQRRDFCTATLMGGALAVLPGIATRAIAAQAPDDPPALPTTAVKDLAARLRGRLISRTDADYEQARRIWNRSFDRHPALIAQCAGAADIARCIAFGRERGLLVAVRGGGHSYAGYSTCDGGLVIDLSPLRAVRVDPIAKTARVAGGAWNQDLDWEAQQYALATPMGRVGNTGVGGLTLGGGYGRLSRLYGLACDNVVAADLITADGKLLKVSAAENPELLWALRGGGGNFGIVSSFEYRLHSVGPQVLAGNLLYEPAQLRDVLEQYVEICAHAPRELALDLSMYTDVTGARHAHVLFCHIGDLRAGAKLLASITAAIKPRTDDVQARDYALVQGAQNGPAVSDNAEYVKTAHVAKVTPQLIDALLQERTVDIALSLSGGAVADVEPAGSAVAHRHEPFLMEMSVDWQDPNQADAKRTQIHAVWDRLVQFTSGFYGNLTVADQQAVDANYGANITRLMKIKKRYDPDNFFRLNANIRPALL
ncbi:MAG TPA: FAD-binding oxidoreductase [Steroidobacteraceae bacterium]|jgi:FAD/FMN-containing dehydrogenase|nr:FAD-binding oxidoreductase [Steroidobacteraceae bacterium]